MNAIKEKITRFAQWAQTPRAKKMLYIVLVLIMVGWVLYRFAAVAAMNRMQVFNPARAAATAGVPVSVMEIKSAPGIVREALTVKNNRAYVSGARAAALRAGMRVAGGEIVSVASNIDLDTGMHVVRTRGVPDGLQMAEFSATGFFVPVYALDNGAVYVVRDGFARRTPVTVARQDDETAYITAGLRDGDIVILSRVADGSKVDIKK